MYDYDIERQKVFTEEGQVMFLKIRDHVNKLLKESGAVRMTEAISCVTGDGWLQIACIDRMVELRELKQITEFVPSQYDVYVKGDS